MDGQNPRQAIGWFNQDSCFCFIPAKCEMNRACIGCVPLSCGVLPKSSNCSGKYETSENIFSLAYCWGLQISNTLPAASSGHLFCFNRDFDYFFGKGPSRTGHCHNRAVFWETDAFRGEKKRARERNWKQDLTFGSDYLLFLRKLVTKTYRKSGAKTRKGTQISKSGQSSFAGSQRTSAVASSAGEPRGFNAEVLSR